MSSDNKICDILQLECEHRGWTVWHERRLVSPAGRTGVPDLMVSGGPWHSLAVRFEGESGSKGNYEVLRLLGVPPLRRKQLATIISRRALVYTIGTLKLFRGLTRGKG